MAEAKKSRTLCSVRLFLRELDSVTVGKHTNRIFKQFLEIIQERSSRCSVNGTVIATQSNLHHIARNHFTIFHYRYSIDATDSQNA